MIQPEPERSTHGYPLVSVEVLSEYIGIVPTEMELILEHTQQGISHEVSIILTKAGNHVKKILPNMNLSDHRKLKDGCKGTWFQLPLIFITTCSYPTIKYKDIVFQDFRYSDTVNPYGFTAPSDDEEPLEDQPLPADASPTTASPGYVADSDPDEDLEEDPEDDHADYPADEGDGDDEPSDDDTNNEDKEPFEDEEDDDKDEEHLASTDSFAVPIADPVLLAGDADALEDNEPTPTPRSPHTIIPLSQTRLRRARKTVKNEPSMSASMKACIARHAALLSPPLSVPSPPLLLPSPLTTSPTDTVAPLGYKAVGIRMKAILPS
nr:hypothetical protein [Tanacetum cinerariifolium]